MAETFATEGARVAINWLDDRKKAEKVAEIVKNLGVETELIQGDVSKVSDARRIVNTTIKTLGSIDFLINTAGVFPSIPFLEMGELDWNYVIDTNLKSCFNLT